MFAQSQIHKVEIPKIIHCIWIGGGNITKIKNLEGIQSWQKNMPEGYEIWIWWDDAHMFNMSEPSIRTLINDQSLKELYENPERYQAIQGRDIYNLRFLEEVRRQLQKSDNHQEIEQLKQKKQKLNQDDKKQIAQIEARISLLEQQDKEKLAIWLINKSKEAFQPLRELAEKDKRVKLCNIRKHEFLPGAVGSRMNWLNRDLYDLEMARRGIFPAAASDILRYEILYNFGGIYMDVDLNLKPEFRSVPQGSLKVENDLALCAYENAKPTQNNKRGFPPTEKMKTIFEKTKECPNGLYAMNNIIATHPRSLFVKALREAIQLAYREMGLVKGTQPLLKDGSILRQFWEKQISKSTLNLTGPNLVREIQYQRSKGIDWQHIPQISVSRLIESLQGQNLAEFRDTGSDIDSTSYHRYANVWRDDKKEHSAFYEWMFENTYFPIEISNI